jgi:hypothetical protein
MSKKINKEYTTIQIEKNINKYIRSLCEKNGWTASAITTEYWLGLISASITGSLQQGA